MEPGRRELLLRALAVAAVAVTLALLAWRCVRPGAEAHGDTRFYRAGAERFVAGRSLYRIDEAPPVDGVRPTTGYTYPPPFAAVSTWMLPLPYRAVRLLWLAAMAGCFAAAFALLARWAGERPRTHGPPGPPNRPWLAAALVALPLARFVVNDLAHGQTNGLVLLLVALALRAADGGRPLASGAALGAAMVTKPTLWLLVLALLARPGRARFAAGLALAAGLLFLPPLLRYGPAGLLDELAGWTGRMAEFADESAGSRGNVSLSATLCRVLAGASRTEHGPFEPVLLSLHPFVVRPWARFAAVVVVLGACALQLRRRPGSPWTPAVLLGLGLLLSPVSWKAHLVALAPAALLVARALADGSSRRAWAAWGLATALLALPSQGALGLERLDDLGATTLGVAIFVGLTSALAPARAEAPAAV